MSSGLLVALEMCAVLAVVLGFGVWELVRLRRDRPKRPDDDPAVKARNEP